MPYRTNASELHDADARADARELDALANEPKKIAYVDAPHIPVSTRTSCEWR
jgi:hypothetical protein